MIPGIAAMFAEKSSGTAELARLVYPPPARSSQPSCQLCSVPGQASAAACSSARISEVRTGTALSSRTATTSVGEIVTGPSDLVSTTMAGSTSCSSPMASVIGGVEPAGKR
jgi:hypothetical protein